MRLLLVHNFYRSENPSGENAVFEMEKRMLESLGHEVRNLQRRSDELAKQGAWGKAKGALVTPWNFSSAAEVRRMVNSFAPHVIHAHNTFPLISPSVFSAAKGGARALTLHNYRLFCAGGTVMRGNAVCTECLDQESVVPGLRYGCYRGSRLATVPLAANIALHRARGTWARDVEAFIALSDFQKERLVAAGLPEARVHVKPNFFPGRPRLTPWDSKRPRVVFAGRVSVEKGIQDLVQAWLTWGVQAPDLVIIGDGPLRAQLEARVQREGAGNVRFLGQQSAAETQRILGESRLLVLPSRWFETFGLTVLEAMVQGTPAVVSDCGPLPDLVREGNGEIFRAGDPDSLLEAIRPLWQDQDRLEQMSVAARRVYEQKYTEESNYEMLMEIYAKAMDRAGVKAPREL
jgi:glycosyltransferase involved in cell wall biosynthesis